MNTITPYTRLRGFVASVILGAFAPSFAAVCAAADGGDTISKVVKYGDLNISNPTGAATLYRRIVKAAYDVCGPNDADTWHSGARTRVNECVHKAITEAVTKVGRPELVTVYNANNRRPLPITVASAQPR